MDDAALLRRRGEEAEAREKGDGKEMRWSEPWWEMARARRAWERAREEVEAIGSMVSRSRKEADCAEMK